MALHIFLEQLLVHGVHLDLAAAAVVVVHHVGALDPGLQGAVRTLPGALAVLKTPCRETALLDSAELHHRSNLASRWVGGGVIWDEEVMMQYRLILKSY